MKKLLIVWAIIFCSKAYAVDVSYLCIAEQGAAVSKTNSGKMDSYSGVAENKYLVSSKNGVRHFGIDANWLSQCKFDDNGRPTWCEYPGESWAGNFMLNSDNTFVLLGLSATSDGKGMEYYSLIGKCSSL